MIARRDVLVYGGAVFASLLAHVALVEGLGSAAARAPREPSRVIELAVVAPPPPPPPEPPPMKPVEVEKIKPKAPPPKDLVVPPAPPPETPPPPVDSRPSEEPPKPVFGISLSSTVGPGSGAGFRVRVGNTTMKEPDAERVDPNDVNGYAPPAERIVPVSEVNKMPKQRGECRGEYPAQAKAQGIEGEVKLDVEVKADGSVGEVKVLTGIGYGLDEVAVGALRRCRFSPAYVGERAVATRITYAYVFLIED